jgi:hypothetical protein
MMNTILRQVTFFNLTLVLSTIWGSAARLNASPPLLLRGDDEGRALVVSHAAPLDRLVLMNATGGSVEVKDAAGRIYFHAPAAPQISFTVGGALGEQTVLFRDAKGIETGRAGFNVDAGTAIDDGGRYRDMFVLLRNGMNTSDPTGVSKAEWNGKTWHYFEPWGLDHYHTMKGMKYFSPVGAEFVDMMREVQREDGMIWSFVLIDGDIPYYQTCYGPFGYVRQYGDRYFVRQPVENHPEYIYVSSVYQCWKASGDDAWMKRHLPSAVRALDYCLNDPARWSRRFQLLKRVYTIDSWDFQVDDAYTPNIGLTNTMLVDPVKSKFGVFFGDNTHYANACEELAEMWEHVQETGQAARFRARAAGIRQRLDALSWNGRFYTHFIDEDPSVQRDLGVDEKTQIAQANAYSLNRGIGPERSTAILKTYLDLKNHLPPGSPGEWYAIYPPFGKGFTLHDAMWQYMNGGVGGHVAGELARGAFENGCESYGLDILERLTDLGQKHNNRIWFSYTGSIPPAPPPPNYTPVDLSAVANMDIEDQGGPASAPWMLIGKPGDDIRGLPTGRQVFAGIPFAVTDPAKNQRRAVLAVSRRPGLPASADLPVNGKAGCIYLLHTSTKPTSEKVCGSVSIIYGDGSRHTQYLIMDKHLTYWWFSRLKTESSGIAWHGPSPVAADVALSWCALDNPYPDRLISSLRFQAPDDDGIYTLAGLTLADRAHYLPPNPVSFGGPDNWAAATAMAAMIEGLAGVKDSPLSEAYSRPRLSPRWDLTTAARVKTTVRYAASKGYVAYTYEHHRADREIALTVTGSGEGMECHILLPGPEASATSVETEGRAMPCRLNSVGSARYVDFTLASAGPQTLRIRY